MTSFIAVYCDGEGEENTREFKTLMDFRVFVEQVLYKALYNGSITSIVIERREENKDE